MTARQLLLVDPDRKADSGLHEMLRTYGWKHDSVFHFDEAVTRQQNGSYSAILGYLPANPEPGIAFLTDLRARRQVARAIALAPGATGSQAIRIMKTGVYECFAEKASPEVLAHRLQSACEAAEARAIQSRLEQQRETRRQQSVMWEDIRRQVRTRSLDRTDHELFRNLTACLKQGRGFGNLLSLASLLRVSAQPGEDLCRVPTELVEMLAENATTAGRALNRFDDLQRVISEGCRLFHLRPRSLGRLVAQASSEAGVWAAMKDQRVILNENGVSEADSVGSMNPALIREALRELLLNACKFSRPESTIYVITQQRERSLRVSVLSRPAAGFDLEASQDHVFTPFFRLNATVDERYPSLDFGLGLTMVEKIAKRHQGRVACARMADYLTSSGEAVERVSFSFELPLQTRTEQLNRGHRSLAMAG